MRIDTQINDTKKLLQFTFSTHMLFAMFATIEKMFMEVARKIICEILTAAASAFVGHLNKK